MTLVASIALFVFGGLFSWLLMARFPSAVYMRDAYLAMMAAGALGAVWAFTHIFAIGIVTIVALLAAGIFGVIGALRKELRSTV